jgi:hypothetical protein
MKRRSEMTNRIFLTVSIAKGNAGAPIAIMPLRFRVGREHVMNFIPRGPCSAENRAREVWFGQIALA